MYNKILVINMLHIGDLLLATPVLATLRARFPQAHLTLLADAKIDGLVRYNQHIDELISVDKKGYHNKFGNYLRLIAAIRRRKFDLVINLHPNERASALAAFSGAKKIVGYSSAGFGLFFDHLLKNMNFDRSLKNLPDIPHQADEHLQMLEKILGIQPLAGAELDMWVDEATQAQAERLWLAAFGRKLFPVIGFNTGASWPSKRWTPAGFAAVADRLLELGYGVAFFGGAMDAENVREIQARQKYPHHPRIAVFTGRVSLLELAALIRRCEVFLTNDSGPMHVAVAQKSKVVAVFGSSNEIGFGPYDQKRSVVITVGDVPCRPCGQHNCDHHSCMTHISPEQVLSAITRLAEPFVPTARPAVFFDRDGVLNVDKNYVHKIEDFEWLPGAREAIKYCNDKGHFTFVITNQSGVARGFYQEEDVRRLHNWMNEELANAGAHIDGFYYCPHHPDQGTGEYRKACSCRKPEPGLILQAMAEWPVAIDQSVLVGDKESDLAAAAAAGLRGILVSGDVSLLNQLRAINEE